MFKKLKDKIAEEVKSSPQRIQQLTQSVTDKIHTATSDDSFFSIGEDDAPTPEPGFSNVSLSNYTTPQSNSRRRTNSNSSMASDLSFLPRYESATNLYHLQSDLDASASEVEDNVSTSSQLGHLSKEQIYAAFQKAQMRYHKYRGRYTDIANHYRELERENGKMKSVLVETQDKALRRVAELREQCSLEQKAKAHLENALRLEIDEKQYIIDTFKTKVDLLQSSKSEDKAELLHIDEGPDLETLTKDLKDAREEIESLNERLQESKANAIVFSSKEADLKNKVRELEELNRQKSNENADVLERERENNLIIAQTKMELHTEIQNRDLEIENLKRDVETFKTDLEQYENKTKSTKLENLQSQNSKLIEKIESLSAKCKNYESELLKLEQVKIENDGKIEQMQKEIKELEEKHVKDIATHRDSTKQHLLTLETKIREKIEAEFKEKEDHLQSDFEDKLKQLAANTNNFQEIQVLLLEKEDEVKKLTGDVDELSGLLQAHKDKYAELETNHLDLINENSENMEKIKKTLKDLDTSKAEKTKVEEEVDVVRAKLETLQVDKVQAGEELQAKSAKILELEELTDKLQKDHSSDNNVKEELAKTKLAFQKKIKEQKTKFHDEIQALNTEITAFKEKNGVIQTYIDEYKQKLDGYEKSSAQKTAQLQELMEQNEKDKKTLHAEIDRLLEGIAETDVIKTELQRVKDEHNQAVNNLRKEVEQRLSTINLLTDENVGLKNQLADLQRTADESKSQLGQKEQLLENLASEKNQLTDKEHRLAAEIAELKDKLAEKYGELSDETTKLSTATTENNELKNLVAEKEGELQRLSAEIKSLRSDLSDRAATQNDSLDENAKLASENSGLKDQIAEELQKLTHESARVSQLESEKSVLQENVLTLETKFDNETKENAQLKTANDDLKAQVLSLKATETDYAKDKRDLEQEITELRNQQVQMLETSSSLTEKVHELVERNRILLNQDEGRQQHYNKALDEITQLQHRNNELTTDFNHVTEENEALLQDLAVTKVKLEDLIVKKTKGQDLAQTETDKKLQAQLHTYEEKYETYQNENKTLQKQVRELEDNCTELVHEKQLLQDEIQEFKISPINVNNNSDDQSENFKQLQTEHEIEVNHLNEKIIQYKSLDLTNRTSIQFYENELQKLKNKNEKLNRKLDETLVTLNHCTELSTSTETEYLRNVLYNYMLGKEGMVLARVIAAVCKFDDNQTEAILQREQQKQTLLGQLGFR